MLNMIRMELYRMFRLKSLYVIWAVMLFMVILTTVDMKAWYEDPQLQEQYEVIEEANADSDINIGMQVSVPTVQGEKATVYDFLYGNIQGKFIALLMVIFVIIYSMADLNTGYIKNIAGQVAKRQNLVLAKVITVFVYVILNMGLFVVAQMLSNRFILGYLEMGAAKELMLYIATQTLLHFALALVCMALAIITRSTLLSMILSVCLCMNVLVILYSLLDKLVEKIGIENFQTIKYTLTGKISLLPMELTGSDVGNTALIAVTLGGIAVIAASFVFKKRDI